MSPGSAMRDLLQLPEDGIGDYSSKLDFCLEI